MHSIFQLKSYQSQHRINLNLCCLIHLPPFSPAPRHLRDLFDGTSPHSLEFKTSIPQYNAAFTFTSLGVNVDPSGKGGLILEKPRLL